jgi:hypothetical protein
LTGGAGGSQENCVLSCLVGRDRQSRADHVPFPCGASGMTAQAPDLVAADLAKLITPGLRSPRLALSALADLAIVRAEMARGTGSAADAIEAVINRGLDAMAGGPGRTGLPRPAAGPVTALRAALALRPGSERVKSRTRRTAAAQAMGLLSADGWRAHHEKPLLRDLAAVICALEPPGPDSDPRPGSSPGTGAGDGGIARFYGDFVDIEGDWDALFSASSTLDLAIMYGATWRHTYRKHLRALAERPGGRIRVILPDPSADSRVAALYAATLRITPDDFCSRVSEAIDDFHSMGPPRHVEVYLTSAAFRHAIYLFSQQAVLAMYALCSERIPTPALLASEGRLLSFIREDFGRLLDQSDRVT